MAFPWPNQTICWGCLLWNRGHMCLSVSLRVLLPREAEPGPVPSLPLGPSLAPLKPGPWDGWARCHCTVASTAFLALSSGAAVSKHLFSALGLDFHSGVH